MVVKASIFWYNANSNRPAMEDKGTVLLSPNRLEKTRLRLRPGLISSWQRNEKDRPVPPFRSLRSLCEIEQDLQPFTLPTMIPFTKYRCRKG